jgi:hypothetical protein
MCSTASPGFVASWCDAGDEMGLYGQTAAANPYHYQSDFQGDRWESNPTRFRIHSPALFHLSYSHHLSTCILRTKTAGIEPAFSGFADQCLTSRPRGHFTRRAGIEPAHSGFGDQHPAIGIDGVSGTVRREGLEPSKTARVSRVTAGCISRSATYANHQQSAWKDLNLRSRAPEARAIPSFATR